MRMAATVAICYQATASEDRKISESYSDFQTACISESIIIVVTSFKISVNPISDPNRVV
jgi:hypothetical protein